MKNYPIINIKYSIYNNVLVVFFFGCKTYKMYYNEMPLSEYKCGMKHDHIKK